MTRANEAALVSGVASQDDTVDGEGTGDCHLLYFYGVPLQCFVCSSQTVEVCSGPQETVCFMLWKPGPNAGGEDWGGEDCGSLSLTQWPSL